MSRSSASAIRHIDQGLDAALARHANRPLEEADPYLVLDARDEKTRSDGMRNSAIADTRVLLIADNVQRVRVIAFTGSQLSAMAVQPPVLSTPARSAAVGHSAPKATPG